MKAYFFLLRAFTPIAKFLFKLEFKGTEHIPDHGNLVVCCNHRSVVDPFLLAVPFQKQVRYMAKSELFTDHGPLARWFLNRMGAFPVNRDRGDTDSVRTAVEILHSGGVMGIFPEGRCMFDGGPFKPKAGAVLIAAKAGADVLPACIYCQGRLIHFRRHVVVRFGPVIPFEKLGLRENVMSDVRTAAGMVAAQVNELLEEGY